RQIDVRPQVHADGTPVGKAASCPNQQQSATATDVQQVFLAGQAEAVKQPIAGAQFAMAAAPDHEQPFDREDQAECAADATDCGQPPRCADYEGQPHCE